MCSIAGYISGNKGQVRLMLNSMVHRAPDDLGLITSLGADSRRRRDESASISRRGDGAKAAATPLQQHEPRARRALRPPSTHWLIAHRS